MTDVPRVSRPEHVDGVWLTEVLHASGALSSGAAVADFDAEPVGTGQMGDSVRYRLQYRGDAGGAPASVVGKFTAADATSRNTGIAMRTYEVEVRFYQQASHTVHIRTPHCYHADVDVTTGEFALVLEDLAPAVQGDQLAGCTPDQAALAMVELARLHGPRWGDPALRDLDWLHRTSTDSIAVGAQLLPMLYAGFQGRYGDVLEPEHMAVGERLSPRIASYLAYRPEPWAIQHGDYRLDNMLFGTAEGGYPLAVVDWQTCVLGPPLLDVSYFLGAGLIPDDRRAHERDLLREYLAALAAEGVDSLSWDRLFEDYRRYAYAGYIMAVGASMMVQQTERGDAMFMTMASRHGAQIIDLESEHLLT